MKRFWKETTVEQVDGGWQVALDGRRIRTQGGAPQIVPTHALAQALADEWRAQGDKVDPAAFPLRDMADYAIDHVARDRAAVTDKLLQFLETDTLCYRADPDEPLWRKQAEVWEPLLSAFEAREGVRLERVSGVGYRAHPEETKAALVESLAKRDAFTLAGLQTLASLAASLCVALEASEGGDTQSLFAAANLEEDWQAEQWGWDPAARERRDGREAQFAAAARFIELARKG